MTAGTLVVSMALAVPAAQSVTEAETLINMDVQDADMLDVLRLLAEVGDINLVADPGLECRMSLTLEGLTWRQALDVVLRSCRWGEDRIGKNLIRVASTEVLRRELEEARRYEEEKKLAGPLRTTYVKLAYARARDLAPLLQRFVSARGEVNFDEHTNTLIITDVAR